MQHNYIITILSYNHPDLTEKTMNSVLAQSFPAEKIFLVHNGSNEKNIFSLKEKFKASQHIVIEKNKGFSGGANQGLTEAFKHSEHVLFLTNDTELLTLPNDFPKTADILSPFIFKRNSSFADSVVGSIHLKTGQLKHLKHLNEITELSTNEKLYAPGTAFGITKNCFQKLNGFDETFHTYWEDVDLSLRAQQSGFKIAHTDQIILKHKIGKTCHKDRFYTLYLFQRNRRKLARKHNLFSIRFLTKYYLEMITLLFKIAFKPNLKLNLNLWWSALHD